MAQLPTSRGVNNTAFSPNADLTAQITGSGQAVPGAVVPTLASTIALDALLFYTRFVSITNTAGVASPTVTTGLIPNPGAHLVVQFNQYSGGSGSLTFSTGFRSTGTVTPSSAKAILVHFVSDGTTFNEVARTSASLT